MSMEIFSLLTKVIIICFSIIGIYYKSGLANGKFKKVSFIYFTNLCLIFCLIYFISSIIFSNSDLLIDFIGFIIICVTVTMTVYHFILIPNKQKTGKDYEIFSFSDIVVHYLVPLLTIIYWTIFVEKGHFEFYFPLFWVIPFLVYFVFILIRARYGSYLEYTKTRYPYDFIDVDKLGVKKTCLNLIIVSSLIIILGYIFLIVDFLLNKISLF